MALKIVKSTLFAPNREQAVLAAQEAFEDGDLAAAEGHFIAALERDENDADLFLQLGVVLYRQDKFNKAVIALRRSLELEPDTVNALNALGVVMYRLAWYAAAEVFFRRVLELSPRHAEARHGLIASMQGVIDTSDVIAPELADLVKLARPA